jgi:tetratricopeptide (TPR) repeat protein
MGEALIMSGTILSKKGKWDIANRKFEQAISLLGNRSQHPVLARAMTGKGIILWRRGLAEEAVLVAKKAYAMAEGFEDQDIMGGAQALMASALFDMGRYDQSLVAGDKAIGHFRKAGNLIELSRVLNNKGETHKVMGHYGKAIEAFNEGLEHTTGKGVRRNIGYLLTNLAECHIREGRRLEARTFVTMAEDNIAGIQDEYLHAMHRFVWGLIFEYEQDLGKASENYMAALLKMLSLGIPFDIGLIQMAYSECLVKQGKLEEAGKHLTDAAASFRKTGARAMAERAEAAIAGLA